jgi:hypothetical protein
MKSFLEFCNESFSSPVPIKWIVTDSTIEGIFYIKQTRIDYKNKYVIKAEKIDKDINVWSYKFYWADGGDKIYGSNNLTSMNEGKFKILATVLEGFKYLLKVKYPTSVIFYANLDENDSNRIPLYNDFCKYVEKENGFKTYKIPHKFKRGNVMIYILYKNEVELNKVIELSKKGHTFFDKIKEFF